MASKPFLQFIFLLCVRNVQTTYNTGRLLLTIISDLVHISEFRTCPRKVDLLGTSPRPRDLIVYYSSAKNSNAVKLTYDNACSTLKSNIPVKIITHGYLNNGHTTWVLKMKDTYLARENSQVILCDWSARSIQGYTQAAEDVALIGQYLGQFMAHLHTRCFLPPENFHCVGHSLGSHVCSFAARHFTQTTGLKIGRLTGLDPAGPCYDDPVVKGLDKTDASMVDAVHTDAGVFGTSLRRGTIDSYPNGGRAIQPGCPFSTVGLNLRDLLGTVGEIFNDRTFISKLVSDVHHFTIFLPESTISIVWGTFSQ